MEGSTNSRIHHVLPECITFNQTALRHFFFLNDMNSSLDSYLVKGSDVSLLSTAIFVYTQFGDTGKWQWENRNPRKLTPVRVFDIDCKPPSPSLNSSRIKSVNLVNQSRARIEYHLTWEGYPSILVLAKHHDLKLL